MKTLQDAGRGPRILFIGLILALAALAALAAAGRAAQPAFAYAAYEHGGIDSCAACHLDGHTRWTPVNEVCNTCHPGFAVPSATTHCWTCHAPGQDMGGARSDASCTSACHLEDGSTSAHVAHPDRPTTCTTCHPLTASLTDAAGSPHHSRPRPAAPFVASFLPASAAIGDRVIVTGTGFAGALAVSFNGTPATVLTVVSDTQVTAVVPAGATSGPVSVTTLAGTGTSATRLTVITPVTARVTLRPVATSVPRGKTARFAGALRPVSLAGAAVRLTVQVRVNGGWKTVRIALAGTTATGAYVWTYKPQRRGSYHARATVAETAAHTAAASAWAAFVVR